MATGLPVASLMATIGLNTAPLMAGMTKAKGIMGGGTLAMGAVLAGTGVIMAWVGVIATKMAGDFQSGITSLTTGAGEFEKNLKADSAGVLQLARDTGLSTKQIIEGLYMINSAGYHGKEGLDVAGASAKAAKVGYADFGVTANAVTTIMTDFKNAHVGASQAANVLIATVANGKTHMEDLASSLSFVLPTAAALHVSLNDTAAAMATMTGQGVPAAESATYLRQTLLALSAPSDGAIKMLSGIGLTSKQVSDMMKVSLPATIQLITDHLKKKFPEGSAEYVASLKTITGGMRQMQGMLDLSGSHLETFKANVLNISTAVKKGGNSISGYALVQKDFNFQASRAREVVETLMIGLGQKLLPVLTNVFSFIADKAIPAVNSVGAAFQGLGRFIADTGPGATALKVVLGILAGAVAGLGVSLLVGAIPAIWASVVAFGAQTIAAGAAAVATLVAAAPFILIGAAIAAVVAIVILAVTHWKDITTALGHFKDMLGDVLGHIGAFIGNVVGGFTKFQLSIVQKAHDLTEGVINFFRQLPFRIEAWLLDLLLRVGKWEVGMVQKAKDLATNFLSALAGLPGKLLSLGEQLIRSLAQGITNARHSVVDAVKNIPLLGGIAGGISHVMDNVPHFATGGIAGLRGPEIALVGEREPEAIIPLSQLPSGMRNGGFSGGGTQTIVINLTADGKRLAQVVVPHIPTVVRNATGIRNF